MGTPVISLQRMHCSVNSCPRPSTFQCFAVNSTVEIRHSKIYLADMHAAFAFSLLLAALAPFVQGQTVTFRSLEESSSPSSYVFNGSDSDIAQQLYIRHKAGDTGDEVELTSVPTAVTERLSAINVDFNSLPGLVQRAVLWDTGFAIAPGNVPVQVYPMHNRTMDNIVIPKWEVSGVDCTFTNCSQPNDVTAYYSHTCTGWQMLNTSHCVIDVFEDSGAGTYLGNMWANGGDPDVAPLIELRDHTWTEPVFNASVTFSVYVVHTVSSSKEVAWGECPSGYGTVSIPCARRDLFSDEFMAANTTVPTGSAWVTTWLEVEFAEESSGFDKILLVPIILGAVVVLGAIGLGWFCWKRKAKNSAQKSTSAAHDLETDQYVALITPEMILGPTGMTTQGSTLSSHYESAGSNKTLTILLDSEHLQGKRIPYDSLVFENAVSKGASGEVWICQYNGQKVAAKRLLQTKDQNAEKFCHGLNHPNSCGDGSEEQPQVTPTPAATPASSSTFSSGLGSRSSTSSLSSSSGGGGGSSRACDCSVKPTLVSTSSVEGSASATSDIARQLYDRFQAGGEVDQLVLKAVPTAVQARLENLSLTFEDLPGLMQRAVLWDTGFAVTSDQLAVRLWTLDNRTMADIAVSVDEFESAGCKSVSCTASNGESVEMYSTCSQGPLQMLAASKCVVEMFESDESSNATMWSTRGNSSTTPDIRVVKTAGATECGCKYTVYSIQTANSDEQPTATGECPVGEWSGSLVIPCYGNNSIPDSIAARITTPTVTDWVTDWIVGHGKPSTTSESSALSQGSASATTESGKGSDGGFSLWWLLLILSIIVLLIVATIVACRHCHRLSRFHSPPDNTTYIFVGGRMWAVEDESHGRGAGYWLRFANWCRKTFNFFE
ncbi:hypothetical protein PC113_g4330 [Phytophthora cactorum]|uniref:Uncharacterized protein n=1 Tax=Phytophthora cactorum TaxID=29920 RepID=A0A8T0ZQY1_9STRA|nr:hypothetical protein PC113_g4330 [Phytophthora cactorum]KAG2923350.1 hypothetical protein PC114_g4806 [Phytophthora cactorum]